MHAECKSWIESHLFSWYKNENSCIQGERYVVGLPFIQRKDFVSHWQNIYTKVFKILFRKVQCFASHYYRAQKLFDVKI